MTWKNRILIAIILSAAVLPAIALFAWILDEMDRSFTDRTVIHYSIQESKESGVFLNTLDLSKKTIEVEDFRFEIHEAWMERSSIADRSGGVSSTGDTRYCIALSAADVRKLAGSCNLAVYYRVSERGDHRFPAQPHTSAGKYMFTWETIPGESFADYLSIECNVSRGMAHR